MYCSCELTITVYHIIHSFPGADDTTLFTKFQRQHKGHSHYQAPQRKLDDPIFTIVHYAGPVVYHIHVSNNNCCMLIAVCLLTYA